MDTTPAPSRATTLPNQTPKRARSSPTPSLADIGKRSHREGTPLLFSLSDSSSPSTPSESSPRDPGSANLSSFCAFLDQQTTPQSPSKSRRISRPSPPRTRSQSVPNATILTTTKPVPITPSTTIISATKPYYHQTKDKSLWKLPALKKSTLIIGTSNLNRITKTSSDTEIHSYPGAQIHQIQSILESYDHDPKPTTIILHKQQQHLFVLDTPASSIEVGIIYIITIKKWLKKNGMKLLDLFKEYSVISKDKTEVHAKLKELDYSKPMAFDANGLFASAMTEGEYPKAESGRPFVPEEEKEFVKLFNKQKFRPRTAILKVWFEYPKNMFFQPIPAKDKITFTNRIEIVKSGGKIIKISDEIVYEENFKTPPYRDYILILKELRNKYKKEGDMVASNCMKLLINSLYGKSIQKDINTSRHLWSEATFKANFDSHVKSYEKVNDSQFIVEMNEEEK
ncbi:hypothetical protein LOTGIDRAFT_163654 [Lottia gigantea]|uniref:DNA-directed DNA polymerase n=1 Tax=Lottia gigantea TaxID=225164 RepID=V4A256_LOTGI|nr:hypothetical protein LOTGIDRAFT_163654 [Lottia gigantea]ESO90772.1 hypothetical protein LOTGIDRAFT_163654 [Lottia gigantea]